jgi:hypothetical protein
MKHSKAERSFGWLLATAGRLHRFYLDERLDELGLYAGIWDEAERDSLAELDEKDKKRLRKLLGQAATNLSQALGGDARDFDIPIDALDDHIS